VKKRLKDEDYRVYQKFGQFLFGLEQCFSTFFGSRHPVRLKKIWRHPYLDIRQFGAPLVVKELKKVVIQYLAAPLTPLYGTLVCRGTQVWKVCLLGSTEPLKCSNCFKTLHTSKAVKIGQKSLKNKQQAFYLC
jgi:hypothetical protein